jgi:hypothetical protein
MLLTGCWLVLRKAVVPGAGQSIAGYLIATVAAAFLLGGVLAFPANDAVLAGLAIKGAACSAKLLIFALAPAVVLFLATRRLASIQTRRVSALVGLSAASLGFLSLWLLCPDEHPLHLCIYHLGPVVGLTLLFRSPRIARYLRW